MCVCECVKGIMVEFKSRYIASREIIAYFQYGNLYGFGNPPTHTDRERKQSNKKKWGWRNGEKEK